MARVKNSPMSRWGGDIGSTIFQCPPVCEKRGTLENSTPNVPRFPNRGKPTKPGYNEKVPRFSSGPLGKMQVLGPLLSARVPWTVLEVLGLHLSQGPSENMEPWPIVLLLASL